jgi:hypothetical protein
MSTTPIAGLTVDNYGRNVSGETDGVSTDTYTVGSWNGSTSAFALPFPLGTAQSSVYQVINSIPPAGSGGLATAAPSLLGNQTNNCGATSDRPDDGTLTVGTMYFDTTLMQPVFWTGFGETGWVDAEGNPI